MRTQKELGLIYNIQHFSLHDGSGIRTIIFMKGCPLRCIWCCNPESQKEFPEVSYKKSQCIGTEECTLCIEACPLHAISKYESKISIDMRKCNHCGLCAELCPAKAIVLLGQYVTAGEVMKIIETDSSYYWRSGGGITISGGEPLMQPFFVAELLKECRHRGIQTAIETSGYFDINDANVSTALSYANLIFYDIKLMDKTQHKVLTGVNNNVILENFLYISKNIPQIKVIVRTPIIPNLTSSIANITEIIDFINMARNVLDYELLPYHSFGQTKYAQLGRIYSLLNVRPPSKNQISRLNNIIKSRRKKE